MHFALSNPVSYGLPATLSHSALKLFLFLLKSSDFVVGSKPLVFRCRKLGVWEG